MDDTKSARPLSINPPGSSLGDENAVLMGTARQYHVPEFEGCLSIKTVVDGAGSCGKVIGGLCLARCKLTVHSQILRGEKQHVSEWLCRSPQLFCPRG